MVEDFITEWEVIKASIKNAEKAHNEFSAINHALTRPEKKDKKKTGARQTGAGGNESRQKAVASGK